MENDQDIISALSNGDEKVFEQLFRHYYKRLCNYACNILNDMDEAEECVQQMLVGVWEKRSGLSINTSVKSYLFKAVHNAALNRIRHGKVRKLYADDYIKTSSESTAPAQNLEKTELQNQIQQAIATLPEQCRLVFKLSRFENMKYAEIATHLGISVKTVENHMGKALKQMREQLKDYLPLLILLMPWPIN